MYLIVISRNLEKGPSEYEGYTNELKSSFVETENMADMSMRLSPGIKSMKNVAIFDGASWQI